MLVVMAEEVKASGQGVGTSYPGSRPWSMLRFMAVCLPSLSE